MFRKRASQIENSSVVVCGLTSQQVWLKYIVRATATAFAIKIYLALTTYGTNDVLSWELFLTTSRLYDGMGLYYRVEQFNHPPFVIHLLSFLGFLRDLTGIPFPFWLRLPAIFADVAAVILVWKILTIADLPNRDCRAVFLMALCPTSIMTSGFHGNTDALMISLLLLSVYLIESNAPPWLAGIAIGLAINVKVVPVIFLPSIVLYLSNNQKRAVFLAVAVTTFLVTSLPYILEDPLFIIVRVFGYSSIAGQWGLSRIFSLLIPEFIPSSILLRINPAKIALVATIVAGSLWMNRRCHRPALFLQLGFIMFIFLSLAPGFGIQYLAWLIPWVVGVGAAATIMHYSVSGLFQFLVYNFWSGGFPWVFADSFLKGSWRGELVVLEVVVWLTVVLVTVWYGSMLKRHYKRHN
jgi:hypothetical protein